MTDRGDKIIPAASCAGGINHQGTWMQPGWVARWAIVCFKNRAAERRPYDVYCSRVRVAEAWGLPMKGTGGRPTGW